MHLNLNEEPQVSLCKHKQLIKYLWSLAVSLRRDRCDCRNETRSVRRRLCGLRQQTSSQCVPHLCCSLWCLDTFIRAQWGARFAKDWLLKLPKEHTAVKQKWNVLHIGGIMWAAAFALRRAKQQKNVQESTDVTLRRPAWTWDEKHVKQEQKNMVQAGVLEMKRSAWHSPNLPVLYLNACLRDFRDWSSKEIKWDSREALQITPHKR